MHSQRISNIHSIQSPVPTLIWRLRLTPGDEAINNTIKDMLQKLSDICSKYDGETDWLSIQIKKWSDKTLSYLDSSEEVESSEAAEIAFRRLDKLFNRIFVDSYNNPLKRSPWLDRGWVWEEENLNEYRVLANQLSFPDISPFDNAPIAATEHLFATEVLAWAQELATQTPSIEPSPIDNSLVRSPVSQQEKMMRIFSYMSEAQKAIDLARRRLEVRRQEEEKRQMMQLFASKLDLFMERNTRETDKFLEEGRQERAAHKQKIDEELTSIQHTHQVERDAMHGDLNEKEQRIQNLEVRVTQAENTIANQGWRICQLRATSDQQDRLIKNLQSRGSGGGGCTIL